MPAFNNSNVPFGFAALEHDGGDCRVTYYIPASAEIIYPGDALKLISAGTVQPADAGETIVGVAAEYSATGDSDPIGVYDDPRQEFIGQCDGAFALADIGQNVNITATTGDTTKRTSLQNIDIGSFGTEGTKQFKVLGLYARGTNAVGSYAVVRVRPNNHVFASGTLGI